MSHQAVKEEVSHILYETQNLSNEEIEQRFGIILQDDGKSVYDPIYHQYFNSIAEWAQFSAEQDEMEMSEHIYSRGQLKDFY